MEKPKNRKIDNIIPGYTGHIPRKTEVDLKTPRVAKGDGHIPGYSGFVQSIHSENLFGKSYGTTTYEVHQTELQTQKMLSGRFFYSFYLVFFG